MTIPAIAPPERSLLSLEAFPSAASVVGVGEDVCVVVVVVVVVEVGVGVGVGVSDVKPAAVIEAGGMLETIKAEIFWLASCFHMRPLQSIPLLRSHWASW
jgi:hypothetical protein